MFELSAFFRPLAAALGLGLVAVAAAPAIVPAPAAAQFSDGFNFLRAVRDRDVLRAKNLADRPGSTIVNARDLDSGDTALHIVTRRRDAPWMRFLIEHGADVSARDRQGEGALMIAAGGGFPDGAQLLLAAGADVNQTNGRGETPLIRAVQRRDVELARLLLAAGADPDQAEHQTGRSARELATDDPRAGPMGRLLEEAAETERRPRQVAGPR